MKSLAKNAIPREKRVESCIDDLLRVFYVYWYPIGGARLGVSDVTTCLRLAYMIQTSECPRTLASDTPAATV